MIKKEQQQQVENHDYICLNPYCTDKNERIFDNQNRHFNSNLCLKWIIKKEELLKIQLQSYNLKSLDHLAINFTNQPLKASQTLQRLKTSDWKKWLSSQQTKAKKQINNSIQIQFQSLRTKIQQLIKKSSFICDLKQLSSRMPNPSNLINQYYESKNIELQSLQNHILFKKLQLKQRIKAIKAEIQKVYWSMMQQKSQLAKLLSYKQQRDYHQYIFEPIDNYYNKLQVLAAALNAKMTSYSIQNQKMSLECILCNRKMHSRINPANKKSIKKYLAQQILLHLYCQHYQQTGFVYSRKIAKSNLIDLAFPNFLQESKHFKTIKVIDRQSGPLFELTYNFFKNNPDTYTVQIVSLKNNAMAKGKHIICSVHQSIDLMIAIISYICTQRGQNVEIESKKEHLKNGLTQILYLKAQQTEVKIAKKEQG